MLAAGSSPSAASAENERDLLAASGRLRPVRKDDSMAATETDKQGKQLESGADGYLAIFWMRMILPMQRL